MADVKPKSEVIAELADEFAERFRRGERPPVSEYVRRHPELGDEIHEVFSALVHVERLAPCDEDDLDTPMSSIASHSLPAHLGDYRIIREVGRGGMGTVYEAEQESLGRHVALKVLPKQTALDSKQRKRFEREAKAAAKLHHTNIVPVFGVGESDGMCYYAMQFIHGLGLDEVLVELNRLREAGDFDLASRHIRVAREQSQPENGRTVRRDVSAADMAQTLVAGRFEHRGLTDESGSGPEKSLDKTIVGATNEPPSRPSTALHDTATGRLSDTSSVLGSDVLPGQSFEEEQSGTRTSYWRSVANVGVQVAEALQHAHDQGILHRDVKPSNLLLDTRGNVWVTDFGLAKTDDQENLTGTGDVVGTLRYMPPEAFNGKADVCSDVYALGLTLYELLALQPAYTEPDRRKLIQQVMNETPEPLHKLAPSIPRDLVTIVHKAIDREPSHRYQTAQELADDLQRYLSDEPIHARRISTVARFGRWCKRNPMAATVTALLLILAIGGPAMAVNQIRLRKEADESAFKESLAAEDARQQKAEAERQRKRAEKNLRKAREAVDNLFTKAAEDLAGEPHMLQIRRELLEDALKFYQGFMRQKSDDPVIRLETAYAYDRVAKIHKILGNASNELEYARRYHGLIKALRRDYPVDSKYRQLLAESRQKLAGALRGKHLHEEAKRHYDQALVEWRELARDFPTNPVYREKIAAWHGGTWRAEGIYWGEISAREHERRLRKALELFEQLHADFPNHPRNNELLFVANRRLGDVLYQSSRFKEAREQYEKAWAFWGRNPPAAIGAKLLTKDLSQVERQFRNDVKREEAIYDRFPDVYGNAHGLSKTLRKLSGVLLALDRFAEAETASRKAFEINKKSLDKIPQHQQGQGQRKHFAWANYDLADILHISGKPREAAEKYRGAFRLFKGLADEFPEVARYQGYCAWTLATCPAKQFRDPPLALRYSKRCLQLQPESSQWNVHGIVQYVAGDFTSAIESLEKCRSLSRGKGPANAMGLLAMAHWKSGNHKLARELYAQFLKELEAEPSLSKYSVESRVFRAEAELMFGRPKGDAEQAAAPVVKADASNPVNNQPAAAPKPEAQGSVDKDQTLEKPENGKSRDKTQENGNEQESGDTVQESKE